MRTIFFIPPLSKMSGGLAAIFELADILQRQGRSVALTGPEAPRAAYEPPFPGLERLPWEELSRWKGFAGQGDIYCVPESWPNAMVPGLNAGVRTLVYAQNWVFFLNNLPQGVAWRGLPLEYLAVSRPVAWVMREVLGLASGGILPAAVSPLFFGQPGGQTDVGPVTGKVRVAWMPRKNKALGRQILQIAQSRLELEAGSSGLEIVEIDNMSREEVAQALAGAHIFLSTGFPEGFALPPLEAMASGCVPVGFSGLGGFEYMRNPANFDLPEVTALYRPPFELPPTPWRCNGLFVSDGDVLGAGLALARAARMAATPAQYPLWGDLLAGIRLTAAAYSLAEREKQVDRIWSELEKEQKARPVS